jgi:hypothetical protein
MRRIGFDITWDDVEVRLTAADAPDLMDVVVAFRNMLFVNLFRLTPPTIDPNGPWAKFTGQLTDLIVDAGCGPSLVLSEESMTVGRVHYPAKPPGTDDATRHPSDVTAPAATGSEGGGKE